MTTPRDQPDQVVTEDTARAPDEHVVTSDADFNPDASPAEPVPSAAADKDGPITSESDTGKDPSTRRKRTGRNRPAERKIKKLTDKLSAAEARDVENANRIADLEGQVETLTDATPKPKEPQLRDFDNAPDYARAHAKWSAAKEPPAPKPTRKPAARPPADPAKPKPVPDQEILDFQAKGKKKLGDEFVAALGEETPVNQLMGEYMIDHDLGPEIYVHLTNNQEEARKIFDSSAPRAEKAMAALAARAVKGELDAGNEGELDIADPPPNPADDDYEDPGHEPPKVTKAPEPPKDTSVDGNAAIPVNPENESMEDYAARRAKEEARKAGRVF
jgi:hypothetical protein